MGRKSVRDMWKAKLAGQEVPPTAHGCRAAAAVTAPMDLQRTHFDGLVLGVDPSLRGTGLAVIEFKGTAVALHDLPIFEYAPLRVKQAVVGAGRASKEQMARTVMGLLGHGAQLGYDEADAAGVALCHAFTWREGVKRK